MEGLLFKILDLASALSSNDIDGQHMIKVRAIISYFTTKNAV